MDFAEKLKYKRARSKLTQSELAEMVGVSLRTIQNYEGGSSLPKQQEIYDKLAQALNTDVNYFLTRGDSFVSKAGEDFGYRGMKDAEDLVTSAKALFAGGSISEEDKETVLLALQEAFFEAKLENKKYTPKKYKKED